MNGPEHYREAERILDHAEESAMEQSPEWYANSVRAAQVHATLALAAATAYPAARDYYGDESNAMHDWAGVVE